MFDVAIWTPINSKSGFGHFYRMLGLYEKLLDEKISVSYFTNNDFIKLNKVNILDTKSNNINEIIKFLQTNLIKIIIIDNYEVDEYTLKMLNNFFKVIYFDSKFKNPQVDGIINFNPFALNKYSKKNPRTEYFLGLEHMNFRKDLKDITDVNTNKDEIFISIGGSDIEHITFKLLSYLPVHMHYNIVLGKGCSSEYYNQVAIKLELLSIHYNLYQQPSDYFEILARSEFAIISCSTTTYEVAYFSKAFICINVIENQNILEEYLSNHNIITLSKDSLKEITDIINKKAFKILKDKNIGLESQSLCNYIKEVLNEG